ncbi:MAG: formate dehydrogenase family accessory protein FdhD [Euryarchaeota archaeon]|nr:formate dehydrogenase family accessory protein FdhD [Euryarchaeota archaeon]|tara:strand:+ start:8691 stop:9527 length:837 start_codon:yes stop_codon:yes gene_type:complete
MAITQYDTTLAEYMDKTVRRPSIKVENGKSSRRPDSVSVESALSIAINKSGETHELGLTMRTPGDDHDLVVGFLHSEGVIESLGCISSIESADDRVIVRLEESTKFNPDELTRRTTMTSSCGICGKDSISNLLHIHGPELTNDFSITHIDVGKAVLGLRTTQSTFDLTGGSHACGRANIEGTIIDAKEDIGRHNAMDKLIGAAIKNEEVPIRQEMVVVSGRASFELVQKALKAGFPIMISIGAPSSLAVDLANEHGMTLISFANEDRMTIFSASNRVC